MNDASAKSPLPGLADPQPRGEGWHVGPEHSKGWSQKKWLMVVAIIFAAHVAFIFAFGERKQIVPLAVTNVHKIVPNMKLADNSSELIALDDPTLFALPHLEGFAGPAWLEPPRVQFHRQDWTEQPRWLPLPAQNLGATFSRFMQTNFFAGHPLDFKPPPKLSEPPVEPVFAQSSAMQVEGDLAQRQLPSQISLTNWPYPDVIAPSKVQVLVDAAGNVVSAVLLPSENNVEVAAHYDAADARALELARSLRFAPSPRLTFGKLIFNWRTVLPVATNSPAASP